MTEIVWRDQRIMCGQHGVVYDRRGWTSKAKLYEPLEAYDVTDMCQELRATRQTFLLWHALMRPAGKLLAGAVVDIVEAELAW